VLNLTAYNGAIKCCCIRVGRLWHSFAKLGTDHLLSVLSNGTTFLLCRTPVHTMIFLNSIKMKKILKCDTIYKYYKSSIFNRHLDRAARVFIFFQPSSSTKELNVISKKLTLAAHSRAAGVALYKLLCSLCGIEASPSVPFSKILKVHL
jgi:hypothetical protein